MIVGELRSLGSSWMWSRYLKVPPTYQGRTDRWKLQVFLFSEGGTPYLVVSRLDSV
jgi:hypothetical protein